MKKFITTFLALAMILSCAVVFSSCGIFTAKPELDLEQAAENLEDADYSVSYVDDEDELSAGVVERLSAYNDDDYLTVTVYGDSKSASIAYKTLKSSFEYYVKEMKLEIQRLENVLNKYDKDLDSDEIDELEDEIKELEKELEELEDIVIGKKGKTVWSGTKAAVEDSKG